ncbi:MAG: hypothetical protein IJX39_06830 [Clostridia bacterium]|nr:hypothetical protein [Clostridia bacterium]
MKSALLELYHNSLADKVTSKDHRERINQLLRCLDRDCTELTKQLGEEAKGVLKNFRNCYDELLCIENDAAFVQGFCLGVKIITEALSD